MDHIEIEIVSGKNKGKVKFDKEYLELFNSHKWHIVNDYLISNHTGKSFHRLIMNAPDDIFVDHKNHDRWDNRLGNLRFATSYENNQNKSKQKNTSSKYYGVYFNKQDNKYRVQFKHNDINITVGSSKNEIEAAEMYDMYVIKHDLNFKSLNFEEKRNMYIQVIRESDINPIKNLTSQYTGVMFDKSKNLFIARIEYKSKSKHLLASKDEKECALAYDDYIVKNAIPNRELNFPENYPNFNPKLEIKTFHEPIDEYTTRLKVNNEPKGCIIDLEDYDKIKYYNCVISNGYVCIYMNSKHVKLSRFLLNVTDPKINVDHIKGDKLDNRKKMLRTVTPDENKKNRGKTTNPTSSQYVGVSYRADQKLWRARVVSNGKMNNIGSFDTEKNAARARDLYFKLVLKEEYRSNFEWLDEEIETYKHLISKYLD